MKNYHFKVKGKDVKIVFPEGDEPRIIGAAVRLLADGLCKPILLGNVDAINEVANARGFNISHLEIIDPETYADDKYAEMVASFVARRKGKVSEEDAQKLLRDVTYFGTMMVYMGLADGFSIWCGSLNRGHCTSSITNHQNKTRSISYKWCVHHDQQRQI